MTWRASSLKSVTTRRFTRAHLSKKTANMRCLTVGDFKEPWPFQLGWVRFFRERRKRRRGETSPLSQLQPG